MADVMLMRGMPEHIRSDNGPEMTAKVVRKLAYAGWSQDAVQRWSRLSEKIFRFDKWSVYRG